MADAVSAADVARYWRIMEGREDASDDFDFVEKLLERHPNLAQCRSPDGALPLRLLLGRAQPGVFTLLCEHGAEHDLLTACAANDLAAVERLLKEDPARINEIDSEGNTPLHWACSARYSLMPRDEEGVVELLIEYGANVEASNARGLDALQQVMLYGTGDAAFLLIEHGATPDILFFVAADEAEELTELLTLSPEAVHWRGEHGRTILHYAVSVEASEEVFEVLLNAGATVDVNAFCRLRTPLHVAIDFHPDVVESLVRYGADVNLREHPMTHRQGDTPLALAVKRDRPGVVEILLRNGARVDETNPRGSTLLYEVKSEDVAELLVAAGLPVESRDQFNDSPLDSAIGEGRRDVALALLRHGAVGHFFSDVAIGDRERVAAALDRDPQLIAQFHQLRPVTPGAEEGIEVPWGSIAGTALHYAVKSGSLAMVDFLIEHGANVNACAPPQLWTPLHDAVYYGVRRDHRDAHAIIRRLAAAGANLAAETWGGYRPIDVADYLGHLGDTADVFDLLASLAAR
jgi:ankyrin repeat protein